MRESILIALVHIFAFITNLSDSKARKGREIVELYLKRHLNPQIASDLLLLYDEYVDFYSVQKTKEDQKDLYAEISEIVSIGDKIKKNLDEKERLIVFIRLSEYIKKNEIPDKKTETFLRGISQSFNISDEDANGVKEFILEENLADISKGKILLIKGIEESNNIIHERFLDENEFLNFKKVQNNSIQGLILIFRLESINTYLLKYYGSNKLNIHGQRVLSGEVYFVDEGSIIKGLKTKPIYFKYLNNAFDNSLSKAKIIIEGDKIEFKFPNSPNGIQPFSFKVESPQMVGIMGGSGVGKSTLLNVMNGKLVLKSGALFINGYNLHKNKDELEGVIGFVPQDDLLIEELSVFENLYFNAKLCYDNYSKLQLLRSIIRVLKDLDLYGIKNLKVGNPLNKTISGGQRKRLNIALELIREPSILYVDEPTSGLSSADSDMVMHLLKEQTIKGKLVIINIHQPSSDIYKLFDKLWILDKGGYPIYDGNPIDAIEYFKKASSFADADDSECVTCGSVNPEQVLNIVETKEIDELGKYTEKRKFSPIEWYSVFNKNKADKITNNKAVLPSNNFKIPGLFEQFKIFSLRNFISKISNKQYLVINLFEAPALAFVLGFFSKYAKEEIYYFGDNKNIPAYLFMSVVVAIFIGLIVSAEEIIKDRKILERESFLNLSRFSYLNSKILFLFILSAIQTLSFVILGNWILEIEGMTFSYWIILFSTSCLANLIGLNISSAFNSVVTIYIIIPFILVPQILLSGAIVHFDDLHKGLTNKTNIPIVGEIMTSRWAYEALAVETFVNNDYEKLFFEYNRKDSEANYYFQYYLPQLKSYIDALVRTKKENTSEEFEKSRTVFNEINYLQKTFNMNIIGDIEFEEFIEIDTLNNIKANLEVLGNHFRNIEREASRKIDSTLNSYISIHGKDELYLFKKKNSNSKLEAIIQNSFEVKKIIHKNNRFIRKLKPGFMYPISNNGRSHLYAPVKMIGNYYIDTKWFNVIIMWLTSLMFYIILYYDLMRKGLKYFK